MSVWLFAQENPTSPKPPCIAAGQSVYRPGTDGVKPPQPPQPNKNDKDAADIRGSFSLELLVNSEGRVCDARVFNAREQSSAEKAAQYISEHWTFKPALKRGKPVAVRFILTWGPR
ncbi:MAG: energy transducer TonB [Terriglobales bacterium]